MGDNACAYNMEGSAVYTDALRLMHVVRALCAKPTSARPDPLPHPVWT